MGVTVFELRNCLIFALTFWQNFVKKFPRPSPSPGAHHVWNLSRPPQALLPRKFWAPSDPPRGRYGGSNFQLPPFPPQIPLVKGRSSSVHGPGSTPATIPEILVNLRATQPEILSISYGPPAPGIYRGPKPINRSLLFCWILLHTAKLRTCCAEGEHCQHEIVSYEFCVTCCVLMTLTCYSTWKSLVSHTRVLY